MRFVATFETPADPRAVATYLSDPRNLIIANNPRPIVERFDDGPTATGSWYILKLDQLRVRVEYVVFDPPKRVSAVLTATGRASLGSRQQLDVRLVRVDGGRGTAISYEVEQVSGVQIPIVGRLLWPLLRRRLQQRFGEIVPTGTART